MHPHVAFPEKKPPLFRHNDPDSQDGGERRSQLLGLADR
jgi:hypothetical protein